MPIGTTTGAAAVSLGEGTADALAPDIKWILASRSGAWTLLPVGAGLARSLQEGKVDRAEGGTWLPDGRQIVFTGWMTGPNARPRIYVQAVDGGLPRALTPEGVVAPRHAVTPDGRMVLGRAGNSWKLYPIAGGEPRIVQLTASDVPIQWNANGTAMYAMALTPFSGASREIFRVDISTGNRSIWKTLTPADPVGIDNIGPIAMTPDARAYCYSYTRRLGDLFSVDGLK